MCPPPLFSRYVSLATFFSAKSFNTFCLHRLDFQCNQEWGLLLDGLCRAGQEKKCYLVLRHCVVMVLKQYVQSLEVQASDLWLEFKGLQRLETTTCGTAKWKNILLLGKEFHVM